MTKVVKTDENLTKCSCPNCPSYNECAKGKDERLFCSSGKSGCKFEMLGCICGSCPVHVENGLGSFYYCINGSADEIDK